LQYLAMDIKYVYIHGTGRNVLLLTVIDVYSRKVLIYRMPTGSCRGGIVGWINFASAPGLSSSDAEVTGLSG
jgi:hypothetical protein